jgi:hypothetical protein
LLPQYGEDLKDRPDSIRYVMGVNVDDSSTEELSGKEVRDFRMYTMPEKTLLLWKHGKHYYVYSFSSGDHLVRATTLLKQLQSNGLATFVANRKGISLRFNEYRKVLAIQVSGPRQ